MFGIPIKKLEKDIWLFLFSILLVHLSAYIIVPIFPLLLKNQKGLSTGEISLVIGMGSLFIQLGSIIAGFISDRLGNKYSMLISNGCQGIALLGMGLVSNYILLVLFSMLNGIGTGIYIPSTKAALTYTASKETRTTAYSLRLIASHIGISLSGLLVLVFYSNSNFFYSAIIYAVLFMLSLSFLPKDCGRQPCPALPLKSYIKIFHNKTFIHFLLLSTLIWGIHTQLAFLLPLKGDVVLNNTSRIGVIWTISSITVILLQQSISNRFLVNKNLKNPFMAGVLLMGFAITLIGFASSFTLLVICGLIFIFGEMLTMPTIDSITSLLSEPDKIGAYFSIASFAAGIGGAAGVFASGRIIEYFGIGGITPWLLLGGFSILTLGLIILYPLPQGNKRA